MRTAFITLAVTVTLLMIAAAVLGAQVEGDRWFVQHFALGLMTTLFTCLCHCIVLAYFMATGKMIRLAFEDAALNLPHVQSAQRLKSKAYAVLMPAIAFALLAAVTGAWATIEPARAPAHLVLVLLSILAQLAAFYREYTLIDANARLMDDVFPPHP